MITGDPHGINDDSSSTIAVPSLVDLLEAKNKTWKTYQEGYPSGTCYTGDRKGKYARKHNPFISIKNIQSDPKRCAKIVGAEKLQIDIDSKQVPDYVWYVWKYLIDRYAVHVALPLHVARFPLTLFENVTTSLYKTCI